MTNNARIASRQAAVTCPPMVDKPDSHDAQQITADTGKTAYTEALKTARCQAKATQSQGYGKPKQRHPNGRVYARIDKARRLGKIALVRYSAA
jgi:hypothetical protein